MHREDQRAALPGGVERLEDLLRRRGQPVGVVVAHVRVGVEPVEARRRRRGRHEQLDQAWVHSRAVDGHRARLDDAGDRAGTRPPRSPYFTVRCGSRSRRSTPSSATSTATSALILDGIGAAARPAPQLVLLPGAGGHRLPARGPAAEGALPRRRARGARADRGRTRGASSRSSASPSATTTSTTPPRSSPTARARRSTARTACPTTASSTSSATSSRGARRRADRRRRRARSGSPSARTSGCPGPPLSDEALAGARLIVNISASPYHAGKGAERERMIAQRARTPSPRSPSARSSAARTSSSSTATRSSSTTRARSSRARRSSPRRCWSATSTSRRRRPARLSDTRHRAPARARPRGASTELGAFDAPRAPRDAAASGAEIAAAARPDARRSTRRSCSARATTSRKNGFEHVVLGLSGGIDSAARRVRRRRRARRRARDLRDDALALLVARARTATRRRLAANLGIELLELPIDGR